MQVINSGGKKECFVSGGKQERIVVRWMQNLPEPDPEVIDFYKDANKQFLDSADFTIRAHHIVRENDT